jgi:hypothetical protein
MLTANGVILFTTFKGAASGGTGGIAGEPRVESGASD